MQVAELIERLREVDGDLEVTCYMTKAVLDLDNSNLVVGGLTTKDYFSPCKVWQAPKTGEVMIDLIPSDRDRKEQYDLSYRRRG